MDCTITALTIQKKNPQRINVFLDGKFAFGLQRITAAWLSVGQRLNEDKIAELKKKDQEEVAYQKALNLLSFRMHSEAEIIKKLQKHEVPEENIESTLTRLKNSGLINDASFAEAWIENRKELRPRGRRALAYELRQKGIKPEAIAQALDGIDEEEMAYQAASKRSQRYLDEDWGAFRLKLSRFLSQRGFAYDVISTVVSRVWEENRQLENKKNEGVE